MPATPLNDIETADERLKSVLTPQRVAAGILSGFAALALVLTAVGLYSVVAFSVTQRRREIAIRLAIGARPGDIFATVLGKALIPTLAGLAAGIALSVPVARLLTATARNVSPHDLPTYLTMAHVLIAAACIAAMIPARRAMRIDPSSTLRSD